MSNLPQKPAPSRGRTLKLYLVDGTPSGVMTAELGVSSALPAGALHANAGKTGDRRLQMMGRPPKPTVRHLADEPYRPDRHGKPRSLPATPTTDAPLGKPLASLGDEERAVWLEVAGLATWLRAPDRLALETYVRLNAMERADLAGMSGAPAAGHEQARRRARPPPGRAGEAADSRVERARRQSIWLAAANAR